MGLIGFGMGGRVFHAPVISSIPELNLAKIYTTKPENVEMARTVYPNSEIVNDVQKIFSDANIQLVVIVTPNQSHYPLALEALKAGKHVVVDKPFTVTSAEADELIKVAKERNKLISVFHNRRWDGDFRTVRKVVESGMLGNIVECEIHYDRFRNYFKNTWKEDDLAGSGLLYDIGSHLIDQALCLFGKPSYVTADLRKQRQGSKAVDNFEIILDYVEAQDVKGQEDGHGVKMTNDGHGIKTTDNKSETNMTNDSCGITVANDDLEGNMTRYRQGLKVTLKAGMLVKEPLPHYIVNGDKGSFVKYGMDIQEADINAGLTPLTKSKWGMESQENYGVINMLVNGLNVRGRVESEAGDYREYYKNIYESIVYGVEPEVTPEQARDVIRIIELAEESSNTRRTIEVDLK